MKQNYTIPRGVLDGVEAFVRVAERRSFRQAAADLDVTPSAVSQAVRALEARMGVALFTRTTRSVGLTEAGQRFLERARPAFEEIVAAGNGPATWVRSPRASCGSRCRGVGRVEYSWTRGAVTEFLFAGREKQPHASKVRRHGPRAETSQRCRRPRRSRGERRSCRR